MMHLLKLRGTRVALSGAAALFLCADEVLADPLSAPLPVELELFGVPMKFSHNPILMCVAAAVIIFFFCWLWGRKLSAENPGRGQILLEMIYGAFGELCSQSIGPNRGRKYLPYIGTLFLFLWTGNMLGLIPLPTANSFIGGESYVDYNHNHRFDPGEWDITKDDANGDGVHNAGFPLPKFSEPTENLNVPFALAILFVLIIGHGSELRLHGIGGYIKSYFSPGGFIGVAMFPLNVVGKIAEIVSISFRLFGNIFGGVVIMHIVGALLAFILMPILLAAFFGIFVGTVQAFVFTMLALTYISMGAAEAEE